MDWRHERWTLQLIEGVLGAAFVVGFAALVTGLVGVLPAAITWAAGVWSSATIVAIVVALVGWPRSSWVSRSCSIVAVVLLAAATLGTANEAAGSFPTIGRLVHLQPVHVVDTADLRQIRAHVTATGKLPPQGVVIRRPIPAPVSHFDTRTAFIYLPPAWFAKVTPSLPTLVLLPGEPGGAGDWSGPGDADDNADAFARRRGGLAPIIVMPDPNGYKTVDSECVNSQFGNAETYLVDDVPAFARKDFNAATGPGSLAIGGLSAGGTCSAMLALRNPSV